MLGTIERENNWKWAAFGKHPAAGDYFRLGDDTPFFEGLFNWVEDGYQLLTANGNSAPDFCSWRFWAKEAGKDFLVCGIVRVSSDSFGRPYPLVITGTGALKNWQENWDLLPFACEKTWRQIEYLASQLFTDLKKLEQEIRMVRPPVPEWDALTSKRKGLYQIGSPMDPYASFLDYRELKKLAASNSDKGEVFVSLDRGPCNDKIMHVSLWHMLFKDALKGMPSALFMGGTLEKAYLAVYRRPLKSSDFNQLWSVSSAAFWKNMIGTEFSMDISELARQPISADKPAGADIRYDPSFDELQTEVDKLSSPALAGSVNWEKVCRLASDILMNRSKDMVAAGYLSVALVYTRRNDGFAMGLKLYLDLLERFWEDLYPSKHRMRGRVRAIEWWVEKAGIALKQLANPSFSTLQLELINENLSRLEIFLSEHLESFPSLNGIREFFSRSSEPIDAPSRHESAGNAVSEPAVEPAPLPSVKRDLEPKDSPFPRTITNRQEADDALGEGLKKVMEASSCLWQQDPASPVCYRLARKAAWYAVEDLPPSVNGRTRIPPPTTTEKNLLFDLRNRGDAEALLKAAEARLSQYIFWLDLNRLAAEALSRLGSRYEKAHEAVCQETAFLMHRLPGLENLSFSDGTPFATPETRQWLEGMVFRRNMSGEALPGPVDTSPEPGMEAAITRNIEEIQLLIRKGNLIEAMEELQRKLKSSSSKREKLLWRLALSRMLVEVGKSRLALPHLDQVLLDIENHGLEEYDPALAIDGLRLAWLALGAQAEQRFKEQATDVLHRIGRLDMPEMVRLTKY